MTNQEKKLTKLEKRILVIRLLEHFGVSDVAKILGMSNSTMIKYREEFKYGVSRLQKISQLADELDEQHEYINKLKDE